MATVIFYRLVDIGHRGMLEKRSVLYGIEIYWLACHAKSEGSVVVENKFFKLSGNTYDIQESLLTYSMEQSPS
jgi:hypothetical protein